jgi:hypothetical protein
MPVYSEMLQDDKIFKSLGGYKRIVIVGCDGCGNDSLALNKNLSQKAIFNSHEGQYRAAPDAMLEEANRLKAKLNSDAEDVRIVIAKSLCSHPTGDQPAEWIELCHGTEAVLSLCCSAGVLGIKQSLGKTVKVIPGMKTVGVLYLYRVYDPVKGLICIDKNKSVVIPFSNKNSLS